MQAFPILGLPLGALQRFFFVEHGLNGGSEMWLAVPGNDTSANIEQNDQRETRQKKSCLASVDKTQAIQPAYYRMINSQTINKQETAVKQNQNRRFSANKALALVDIRHFKQHHYYKQGEHLCEKKRSTPLVQSQTQTHPIQKLLEKKQRALLRRQRIRKFRKQLGFFEDDGSSSSSYSE